MLHQIAINVWEIFNQDSLLMKRYIVLWLFKNYCMYSYAPFGMVLFSEQGVENILCHCILILMSLQFLSSILTRYSSCSIISCKKYLIVIIVWVISKETKIIIFKRSISGSIFCCMIVINIVLMMVSLLDIKT